MKRSEADTAFSIPPKLLAELQLAADTERCSAAELVAAMLERWLGERGDVEPRAGQDAGFDGVAPAEAVERILKLRAGIALPDGVSIKDLMTHGRA